jgi:S1/P1 Nuclease
MRKLLVSILCGALPAFGWGGEGHDLIARLAWVQLTPTVQARVTEILGPNVTIQSIASWADNVRNQRRETGPWHYIDIPIDKPHLDMTRDCPKGDCVIAKIEDFQKILKDPATPPVQRKEALMFLVHFVGDMHQPLHCSDNNDQGGNKVIVAFGDHAGDRPYNLHSLWDSGLLGKMPKEDDLFAVYSKESIRHAKKWARGSVEEWAEENHKVAQKITYGKLPKEPAGTPEPIDAAYEKKADAVIQVQIEKAGARLARVLNEALQ